MHASSEDSARELTAGGIGEVALIRRLAARLRDPGEGVVGIGDDTAVVPGPPGEEWLLTSDALLEGVHFLPDAEPERIGHKAVARNLSDIAAMGGVPGYGLINLVAPLDIPVARLERIYDGAAAAAERYGLALIGGDTTCGGSLAIHVFLTGAVPAGTACLRSGAKPGDRIWVTGALGGSLAGRHLSFEPRVPEGQWIRAGGWATAMIDLSDGVATDLRHVMDASGTGARLDAERIPISDAARTARDRRTPLEHALEDGEDYELLLTVPRNLAADFADAWQSAFSLPCTEIGEILCAGSGLCIRGADGTDRAPGTGGYEHFRV